MSAFDFTLADLEANQRGQITKEQRFRLHEGYKISPVHIVVPAIWGVVRVIGVIALFYLPFLLLLKFFPNLFPNRNPINIAQSLFNVAVLVAAIIFVSLLAITVVSVVLIQRKVAADLSVGRVSLTCGRIGLHAPDYEMGQQSWQSRITKVQSASFKLKVNGIEFSLSRRQWTALIDKNKRPFCFYYTPNSKIILSAEEMSV